MPPNPDSPALCQIILIDLRNIDQESSMASSSIFLPSESIWSSCRITVKFVRSDLLFTTSLAQWVWEVCTQDSQYAVIEYYLRTLHAGAEQKTVVYLPSLLTSSLQKDPWWRLLV